MKLLKLSFVIAFVGILVITCKKSGTPPKPAIDIQGFMMVDFSGNLIGWQGTPDSDWKIRPSLSAAEMAVLNFNTGLSLANTTRSGTLNFIAVPNPAWTIQAFDCNPSDSNVVKIVYVDSMLRVLKDTAMKVKGGTYVGIQLNDRALFPDHSSRRVYFSFSAQGFPDYAVGYGDVRICSQTTVTNCF